MKLGKHQELYRRYMKCLDTHVSHYFCNQEKWMMSHLDDFYDEDSCKTYLDDLCNRPVADHNGPFDFSTLEELELKLAIYDC